jgi:ATP-dependent Lhr-like helicase
VHHGSLSKVIREEAEEKLRAGSAGIVVCTSSLELGLDIGSVELVIHYGSPRQVSKMMQRIGRSRHKNETSAKGLIVTNFPDDEIEAYAIVRRMKKHSIEEQLIHKDALDVVAHHIVGMALQTREAVNFDIAVDTIRKAYPFGDLDVHDIEGCISVLDKQGIIKYDSETQSYRRRVRAYKYYFDNLSMIPHVLKFDVIDSVNKKKIGTLDQQFVGDYGEKGNVFVLKGSQWRIVSVDEDRLHIYVEPLHAAAINIPYWVGELIPVDYKTAEEVGIIRNQILRNCVKLSGCPSEIYEIKNSLGIIPDSKNIVVECYFQQNLIVIHSTFGTKVNNTIASLLSTLLSSQLGYIVETRSDPYRVMLKSSAKISKGHVEAAFKDIYDIEPVIIASFTGTYNINWKVWSVAKRFGIINKDAIYDKKAARMIYDRYAKTPVSKESIRELLHDKYDISLTQKILQDFKKGDIKLHWFNTSQFCTLAKPILDHTTKLSFAPLSIEKGIIELVKERLEKTKHRLICIRCGKWERTLETKEVEENNLVCPNCRSHLITSTFFSDNDLIKIILKRLTGGKLCSQENHRFERAWKVASLINNFGKQALVVLSGYGIGADTAARLLRNYVDDEELYRNIYESERQYITTRGFWSD